MTEKFPAIFAALDDEIRIIKSKMVVDKKIYLKPSVIIKGELNKKSLILVRTGIGKKAMAKAVDYTLSNFDVSFCINVGYAGGADPSLNTGDIVIADPVIDDESKKSFSPAPALLEKISAICAKKDMKAARLGLVTVNKVISTPHEKAFVGTEYGAAAIDMESSSFMEACASRNVDSAVFRVILDPLDMKLPNMGDTLEDNGEASFGNITEHFIHNPKDIVSIPKIEYCAMKAREAINTFVEGLIET